MIQIKRKYSLKTPFFRYEEQQAPAVVSADCLFHFSHKSAGAVSCCSRVIFNFHKSWASLFCLFFSLFLFRVCFIHFSIISLRSQGEVKYRLLHMCYHNINI